MLCHELRIVGFASMIIYSSNWREAITLVEWVQWTAVLLPAGCILQKHLVTLALSHECNNHSSVDLSLPMCQCHRCIVFHWILVVHDLEVNGV